MNCSVARFLLFDSEFKKGLLIGLFDKILNEWDVLVQMNSSGMSFHETCWNMGLSDEILYLRNTILIFPKTHWLLKLQNIPEKNIWDKDRPLPNKQLELEDQNINMICDMCIWVFPKMVLPPISTTKWSFLVGKPMVVGYHHFRKPPHTIVLQIPFQEVSKDAKNLPKKIYSQFRVVEH